MIIIPIKWLFYWGYVSYFQTNPNEGGTKSVKLIRMAKLQVRHSTFGLRNIEKHRETQMRAARKHTNPAKPANPSAPLISSYLISIYSLGFWCSVVFYTILQEKACPWNNQCSYMFILSTVYTFSRWDLNWVLFKSCGSRNPIEIIVVFPCDFLQEDLRCSDFSLINRHPQEPCQRKSNSNLQPFVNS